MRRTRQSCLRRPRVLLLIPSLISLATAWVTEVWPCPAPWLLRSFAWDVPSRRIRFSHRLRLRAFPPDSLEAEIHSKSD